MDKLTKTAVNRYVQEGGIFCPNCQSEAIGPTSKPLSPCTGELGRLDMACAECEAEWTELHQVAGIELPGREPVMVTRRK